MTNAVARRGDPWTSWEAARSVTGIRDTQAQVLWALRADGAMTHQEIQAALERQWPQLHFSPSGVRTRTRELVDMGLVRHTGEWRRTHARRRTKVWEALRTASAQAGLFA